MRTYHLGVLKAGDTLVLQARRCVDFLDCEIWLYLGERATTKRRLHQNRARILELLNRNENTNFQCMIVD